MEAIVDLSGHKVSAANTITWCVQKKIETSVESLYSRWSSQTSTTNIRFCQSPEVFRNTESFDGFAIDMWAAGVILYIMLTGFPPYDQASRTDQRFELIVSGKLVKQLKNWGINLSEDAGNLLQSMLQLKPKDRLTLAQVMAHPWVTNPDVEIPVPVEPFR